ncbi:DUF2755 family protein [Dryocola clanedunensis]|uniref:DUF2755 family protein n=1 Tax=Cedecea sulfonylureivorans TaxID=3051154 RepID=UPI001926903A|nr:DUF2755 family protein [Cedecea sulfonylureivorans]
MTEISLSKHVVPTTITVSSTKTTGATLSNIAYAVFILFCFWVGSQILNLLVNAPGVLEHLAQGNDATRPRIEMGLAVSTVFGLVPFLLGCAFLGMIALMVKYHHRHEY